MNEHPDIVPSFEDAALEREWLAQEDAMRRERLNLGPASDDERARHYQLLARALRQPPRHALPTDFAARIAGRANLSSSARFEIALMGVLIAALVIVAAVVSLTYGREWVPSFHAIVQARSSPASVWLLALAACLGASWLMERWPRLLHR